MSLVNRVRLRIDRAIASALSRDAVTGLKFSPGSLKLAKFGSDYGGWLAPVDRIKKDSICYCVGVGEDISFDLALVEKFGCDVYAFDPTPRAIKHVERVAGDNRAYHFFPIGLWDREEVLKFYSPANPDHVSHSAVNLQKTESYFEAPCKRLSAVMKENGHTHLDLLKLDVEGAEYKVLQSILEDNLDIDFICVEYDEVGVPLDSGYKDRIRASIESLLAAGYSLVDAHVCNYAFARL